ncbi:MAG: nucleotidyltransferase family protein [Gammaproteobacteria bacterium]|nr:nucleotidyltransferase family protein [Gammaproteobacteria bacterium]
MRIAGIVTEFNPITYGHLYLINKIKKEYNMDSIVTVMSPNFVMRGEPAIISKIERTKMALKSGVDLVLELPTIYAIEAADIFASRSVEILNNAGVTDLFFGAECDDIKILTNIAKAELSKEYNKFLKEYLKNGLSFNTASKKALYQINQNYEDVLKEPNNSLAIEYIKAIISNGYNIEVHPIKRVDSGYFDKLKKNTLIQSASFLRDELKKKKPNKKYFPYDLKNIEKHVNEDYFELIKYKIISSSLDDLRSIHGITDGFENKLKSIKEFKDYDTLVNDLVSLSLFETKSLTKVS